MDQVLEDMNAMGVGGWETLVKRLSASTHTVGEAKATHLVILSWVLKHRDLFSDAPMILRRNFSCKYRK